MKTFVEIGNFLANPLVGAMFVAVIALPLLWVTLEVCSWLSSLFNSNYKK